MKELFQLFVFSRCRYTNPSRPSAFLYPSLQVTRQFFFWLWRVILSYVINMKQMTDQKFPFSSFLVDSDTIWDWYSSTYFFSYLLASSFFFFEHASAKELAWPSSPCMTYASGPSQIYMTTFWFWNESSVFFTCTVAQERLRGLVNKQAIIYHDFVTFLFVSNYADHKAIRKI